MPKRYSQEETKKIQDLVAQALSNREIAQQLGRAETGIRNIRHRLKLKINTQHQLKSLLQEKTELEKKVQELRRSQVQETIQLSSLQNKREETKALLELERARQATARMIRLDVIMQPDTSSLDSCRNRRIVLTEHISRFQLIPCD